MILNKTNPPKPLRSMLANQMRAGLVLLFCFMNLADVQATEIPVPLPVYKVINLKPIVAFDEIPVEIYIKGYGKIEVDVLITESNKIYIDIEDLFTKLGVSCTKNDDKLTGFIENESKPYRIDIIERQITIGINIISSPNGLYKHAGAIYIESNVITEAFGLNMVFNYRSLTIMMDANFELPLVKKARLDKIRQNVTMLQSQNEVKIDTVIGRNYHLLKGLAVDWLVNSNQIQGEKSLNRYALGLGTELLYGAATVGFNYYDQTKFDRRQLYYNWRWVDNENKFIRQAQVGKVATPTIAFLGAPLVGASLNNSPNTVRKAKGSYMIRDYTEPNWTVELYINDVLVSYTASDASGLYVFEVPIVYGYNTLKLKFYGLLGEERIEERTVNNPYIFMPKNVIEYNVIGGVLEDKSGSQFGRGEFNYGVTKSLTVGGGVEYLSSLIDQSAIPFANIAFQPLTKMILKMKYASGVSYSGLLNYYFGKSTFLELDYTNFVQGQTVTLNRTNEELRLQLTVPFKVKDVSGITQFNYVKYVFDTFDFNQFNAVFSGRYKNYSSNVSLSSNWITAGDPFISSTVVLSYRLLNGLIIRPSFQYNITDSNMMRYGAGIEKRLAKMNFSASYERNVQYATNNLLFNFKYDLPYARTNISAGYSNKVLNFSESLQGSLAFGGDNGYVNKGNNSTLGKGGVLLYPFLDANGNGKRDKGEKMILLNNVRVSGGKAKIDDKDFIVRISDLNAFVNYNIEFSDAELENISWRFKHHSYQILVDPNQYKKIEVPIVVMGEVNGIVNLNVEEKLKGLGRINIQIFTDQGKKVVETLSESDGYFSYLGLKPGKFIVKVDDKQLEKLDYKSSPQLHQVEIEVSEDGTIVKGLDFQITSKDAKVDAKVPNVIIPETKVNFEEKMLLDTITPKSINNILDSEELFYSIKVGVYKDHSMPKELGNLDTVFYEDLADGKVQYYYGFFRNLDRAIIAKNVLVFRGINGTSIVTYQFGKKITTPSLVMKKEEVLKENDIPIIAVNQGNAKKNISFAKISDTKEDFFSVQIGVFRNYVPSELLRHFNPVYYEFKEDGLIRYISGQFKTFGEAKNMKYRINEKGIKDAFIVKYRNGLRSDSKKD